MALHGIDIASWQASMNAGKMAVDFVIIKATGGTGYVNPHCDKHFQQAKKAGKLLGVYHYANERGYEGTAKQEANYFVKNAKNYLKGDAIPILDWESSNKGNVKWALDWLNEVERQTGIKPWFYTYTNVLNTFNFSRIYKNDNALWIAQYPDMATHYGFIKNKKPPRTRKFPNGPAAYQYSSTTVIPGYGSPIDVDIFYGDKKAWQAYATPNGEQPKNVGSNDKDSGSGSSSSKEKGSKSNKTIAKEVIAGKWGNGDNRISKLKSAGYNPTAIQKLVDKQLGGSKSSGSKTYTVKSGDTLSGIGQKLGISWKTLASKNGLSSPYTLYPGQKLSYGSGSSANKTYTVKSGDTLSGIGQKLGINWKTLARKNGLSSPYTLYPGQKLSYGSGSGSDSSANKTYTVKSGDTLSGIGSKLGVNWKTIANLNGLSKPYTLYPGQKLKYKGGSGGGSKTYTVKSGDTLSGIGAKLGIKWTTLANKNGLKKPYTLYPGQKLKY